jgi:predicted type IV restriction endonuclease
MSTQPLNPREAAAYEIRTTLTQLKQFLAQEVPPKLSEADTKAVFIDRYVAALGYEGLQDIVREFYVKNSQEFIDYVLRVDGKPSLAVEAKPVQTDLTDKHAAQLIQYCSVEGIEWCALTNGRSFWLFNTFLKGDLHQKLVVKIDLLGFNSNDEFDAIFDQLWLLSKASLASPTALNSWMEQRRLDQAARAILLNQHSEVVKVLVAELASAAHVSASPDDVVQWVRGRLMPNLAVVPNVPPVLPKYEPKSQPAESGPQYWLMPCKAAPDGAKPVQELHRWLDKGYWGVGGNTPGRKRLRAGDYACFYASGVGVVAAARIAGPADTVVSAAEWPEPTPYTAGTFKVPLKEVSWLEKVVPVTKERRAQLEAFAAKDQDGPWSWLVLSTSKLSPHDFAVLTGESAAA